MAKRPSNMRLGKSTLVYIDKLIQQFGGDKTSTVEWAVRELAEKKGVTLMKKHRWVHEEAQIEDIAATDLRKEASQLENAQAFTIRIEGETQRADALYDPNTKRMGIAWGADATWADVVDVESGIEMWINNHEEWEEKN